MRATDPQREEGAVAAQPCAVSEALTTPCEREEAPRLPSPNRKAGQCGGAAAAWMWGPRARYHGQLRVRQHLGLELRKPELDALSTREGESHIL